MEENEHRQVWDVWSRSPENDAGTFVKSVQESPMLNKYAHDMMYIDMRICHLHIFCVKYIVHKFHPYVIWLLHKMFVFWSTEWPGHLASYRCSGLVAIQGPGDWDPPKWRPCTNLVTSHKICSCSTSKPLLLQWNASQHKTCRLIYEPAR